MNKHLFIITGGNFKNSGAESMLLITISELRKRYPDCSIVVDMPRVDLLDLNFVQKEFTWGMWEYAANGKDRIKAVVKKGIKKVIGRKENYADYAYLRDTLGRADALIDISGLALTSQWDVDISRIYLKAIRAANNNSVPVVLMPQSFGPFNFKDKQSLIDREIKNELGKVKKIYAREQTGFESLTQKYGLHNVIKSCDLVLQNKEFDAKCAVNNYPIREFTIPDNAVAVIPNLRAFERDRSGNLLALYNEIIRILCEKGRNVVLLRHSTEDLEPCEQIYESFLDNDRVFLIKDDLNSMEYSSIIGKFDYAIASRYHSIIHAYKKGVPAIVLGWAEKYHELVSMFNQNTYYFDVRNDIDKDAIISAINKLDKECSKESKCILDILPAYQRTNCFDILSTIISNN